MHLPFSCAEGVADALSRAATASARWLLLVADRHAADIPALLQACRGRDVAVCGGVFPGLIHGARRLDEGLIALPLPGPTRLATARLDAAGVTWRTEAAPLEAGGEASAMLLVDCQAAGITGFLEEIFDRYGNRIHYAGAGAGYSDLRREPSVFDGEGFIAEGALFLLVPQRATVCVQHGWSRAAGPFVATRTRGNVIQELNWEPAGTYYRTQIGLLDPALRDKPVYPDLNTRYPLSIGKEGGEDVVRDPICISEADEVVVLSDVAENSAMYLSRGDARTLVDAARQAVALCGRPHDVDACFISDCYSRALMLGADFPTELQAADEALKRFTDVPAEGVLALGEIAANGRSNLEFFNKTFVVALRHG